jgi:hypothetical protein
VMGKILPFLGRQLHLSDLDHSSEDRRRRGSYGACRTSDLARRPADGLTGHLFLN